MTKANRKFTLLDGMILTAATAVGMGLMRSRGFQWPQTRGWLWYTSVLLEGIWSSWQMLIALTPALLLIRFCHPRPRLGKTLGQPGVLACCATILAVSYDTSR